MNTCPDAEALARMGNESLTWSSNELLEHHVDDCPQCQGRLDGLAARHDVSGCAPTSALPALNVWPLIPGFVIESELGRGATSVVCQARQPSVNRRVALKVVRSGPAGGTREHARWLREANLWSRMRHENVVRLYHVGETNGWLYLVLELIPGGTLQDGLDMAYCPTDAARLLATVAGAVAAIHREGLIHLDLKPSEALTDDLKRWLDRRPIAARPASVLEGGWRACRRRPAVAALAASLM